MNESKPETTGKRCTKYSEFHRTLGTPCYALDIDWVEWRPEQGIVALICVTGNLTNKKHIQNAKPYIWKRTKLERKILRETANALKVKAYYVIHDNNLSYFEVFDLDYPLVNPMELNQENYADFIRGLGKGKFLYEYA